MPFPQCPIFNYPANNVSFEMTKCEVKLGIPPMTDRAIRLFSVVREIRVLSKSSRSVGQLAEHRSHREQDRLLLASRAYRIRPSVLAQRVPHRGAARRPGRRAQT